MLSWYSDFSGHYPRPSAYCFCADLKSANEIHINNAKSNDFRSRARSDQNWINLSVSVRDEEMDGRRGQKNEFIILIPLANHHSVTEMWKKLAQLKTPAVVVVSEVVG